MLRSLVLALALAACSNHADAPAAGAAGSAGSVVAHDKKNPALARQWLAAGAKVIDVRTPEEFGEGHLDSAVNIPVDQLGDHMADVAKLAGKDQQIVVYCASGGRAATAQRALSAAGYTQVVNGGGYGDLKDAPHAAAGSASP